VSTERRGRSDPWQATATAEEDARSSMTERFNQNPVLICQVSTEPRCFYLKVFRVMQSQLRSMELSSGDCWKNSKLPRPPPKPHRVEEFCARARVRDHASFSRNPQAFGDAHLLNMDVLSFLMWPRWLRFTANPYLCLYC